MTLSQLGLEAVERIMNDDNSEGGGLCYLEVQATQSHAQIETKHKNIEIRSGWLISLSRYEQQTSRNAGLKRCS
jgi:hypothetical protein